MAPVDRVCRTPHPFMVLTSAAGARAAVCRTDSITAIDARKKMPSQVESMPAPHVPEPGPGR